MYEWAPVVLPLSIGVIIALLRYMKQYSFYGFCPVGGTWSYIGPRMVIPCVVAVTQYILGEPVVGGNATTQVLAYAGCIIILEWLVVILVHSATGPGKIVKQEVEVIDQSRTN